MKFRRYLMICPSVAGDPRLSAAAKFVHGALVARFDNVPRERERSCRASLVDLSLATGVAVEDVSRAIVELDASGLLVLEGAGSCDATPTDPLDVYPRHPSEPEDWCEGIEIDLTEEAA